MRIGSIVFLLVSLILTSACETSPDGGAGSAATTGTGAGATGMGAGGGAGVGGVGGAGRVEAAGSAAALAQELEQVGDTVYFEFDEYTLSPEGRVVVERQAALLAASPAFGVRINGHTDERGTREYNLALGDRRANAVRDYLIALGVESSRIDTVSYGEERPAVLGSTDGAWARNRRAVTEITSGQVGS